MNIRFNTVALTGNFRDPRAVDSLRALTDHLARSGIKIVVSERVSLDKKYPKVRQSPEAVLTDHAELIVAVGGDGTMLFAARQAAAADIPLVGINRGRLGFLADVSPDDMLNQLDKIISGVFENEKRMLLKAEIVSEQGTSDCGYALNDIVVKRQDTGRMLEFQTFVDDDYVNTHGGDGFIVASPTGSTAYALSCGGPIVAPGLDAIVLAPICPHTLSDRPLVISATAVTQVRLREAHTEKAEVSCDGEVKGTLGSGDSLRIAAAERRVELLHPTGYNYFQILRSKLRWGRGSQDDAPAC
jgi:NAD+ kinase